MINRSLGPILARSKKSILLLGPRQTGKSTLIQSLKPGLTINFAHEPTYLQFARNPAELEQRLASTPVTTVFIDEVQRIPSILNTLQSLLDERGNRTKFYLTGSSARKLMRGKANLLPGRVHTYHLPPLTAKEIGPAMDLAQALSTGTLPGIWTERNQQEKILTLRSYAATYLKEEIQAEALTKNVEGFSRFIFVMAAWAGKFLDLAKLASEAQIPRQTAVRYFEILEDTLIVRRCESFSKTDWRRLVRSPRFFFFDTGVLNGLLDNFSVSQDRIGVLFEHFVFNQLIDHASSTGGSVRISSYRTGHGAEVDFIVEHGGRVTALEVKASRSIGRSDLRGFKSFAEHYNKKHGRIVAYMGDTERTIGDVQVVPWQRVFEKIGPAK